MHPKTLEKEQLNRQNVKSEEGWINRQQRLKLRQNRI